MVLVGCLSQEQPCLEVLRLTANDRFKNGSCASVVVALDLDLSEQHLGLPVGVEEPGTSHERADLAHLGGRGAGAG